MNNHDFLLSFPLSSLSLTTLTPYTLTMRHTQAERMLTKLKLLWENTNRAMTILILLPTLRRECWTGLKVERTRVRLIML